MINQGNQLMTKEIWLNVGHVKRYCKLTTICRHLENNSCVYANFSCFFSYKFVVCKNDLLLM